MEYPFDPFDTFAFGGGEEMVGPWLPENGASYGLTHKANAGLCVP
jgi:hypothetical protein